VSTGPPDITIRPLRSDDYPDTCRVWRAAGLDIKTTGRDAEAAFREQLAHFPALYLAAECDGRIVGVVLGTHDRRKGWINRLAVDPEYQRRGIGLALIRACEQALRAAGIEIIAALIEHGNEASVQLFERAGYVADVPVYYYRKREREDI